MDPLVVEKHLIHIVETVDLLRKRARPAALASDPAELYFVVYALQTAVQAAIDVAAIIVSWRRLGEPRTNRELFQKMAQDGWIRAEDVVIWNGIVAFRNIVVHRYLQVDPAVVGTIVEQRLDDLLGFVRQVRDRMQAGA